MTVSADALEVFEHLVGRHLANEEKETGRAGLQRFVGLGLHLLVVDTHIHQRTPKRSRRRADDGQKKEPADQHAPERARHRAGRRGMHELISFTRPFSSRDAMTGSPTSMRYSFCIPRILSRTSSAFFSVSNPIKTRSLLVSLPENSRGLGRSGLLRPFCDHLASAPSASVRISCPQARRTPKHRRFGWIWPARDQLRAPTIARQKPL